MNNNVNPWYSYYAKIEKYLFLDAEILEKFKERFTKIASITDELIKNVEENISEEELKINNKTIYSEKMVPNIDIIINYIEAYYNLAVLCFTHKDLFVQSKKGQEIIADIFTVGLSLDKKSNSNANFPLWFLSPFVLNALRLFYERRKLFTKDLEKSDLTNLKNIRENIFIDYILSLFENQIFTNNALYFTDYQTNQVIQKNASELSSIFPVYLPRLYTKIKDYIDSVNSKVKDEIKIALIGDVDELELKQLDFLLASSGYKNYKFNVLSKEKGINYDELFTKEGIHNLINNNDLMFFLVNLNMYAENIELMNRTNWDNQVLNLKARSYNDYVTKLMINNLEDRIGILENIKNDFQNLCNTSPYENLKNSKTHLLDYLNKSINNLPKNIFPKTIYSYLLNNEKSNEFWFESLENHRGNFLKIMKYSNFAYQEIEKPQNQKDNYFLKPIDFSLLEIIENVDEKTIRNLDDNRRNILKNIGVRFSWDKNIENFTIEWGYKGNILNSNIDKQITELLYSLFSLILNEYKYKYECRTIKYLDNNVLKEAMFNLISNKADTLYHLLILYRIRNYEFRNSNIKCKKCNNEKKIEDILKNCIISNRKDKNIYYKVLEMFNDPSTDDEHYRLFRCSIVYILSQYNKNRNLEDMLKDIQYACEKSGYTDAYIYKREPVLNIDE